MGIAEAMASGAAPVVSDLACFTDLVAAERNGLVFRRDAPDPAGELAEALARLVRNHALRASLASAAQIDAARCDTSRVAEAMLEDFASLLLPTG